MVTARWMSAGFISTTRMRPACLDLTRRPQRGGANHKRQPLRETRFHMEPATEQVAVRLSSWRQLDETCPHAICRLCALECCQEFLREILLQMEILCSLRLVDLVKNKRICIVLARGDVKGFHPRLRPNLRQVFAQRLNEFHATLWLNLCFDQHDYLFVCHTRLLLATVTGQRA